MNMQWLELTERQGEWLTQALALYERTFPDEVREPHDVLLRGLEQRATLAPGVFHFLLAVDERDRVAALSTAHYLADVQFGFVVYLAVEAHVRSRGLGGEMLARMESVLRHDAGKQQRQLRGIILETEKEEEASTSAERAECRQRSRFFQRQGYGRAQDVYYVQPPLRASTPEVPLHLYVKWLADEAVLNGAELRRVVQAMYKEKYGKINHVAVDLLQRCAQRLQVPEGPLQLTKDEEKGNASTTGEL